MLVPALFVLSLEAGCIGAITLDDTGKGDTAAVDTDGDTDADTDTDVPPVDRDGDGAAEADDCDDTDADVFPGAPEAWDDIDSDCDGVVDGDGAWSGEASLDASAVYEGRRYNFSLRCPFVGTRLAATLDFTITCTPDPTDEDAQRLLGATLIIAPTDHDVAGDTWDDGVEFTSANGWDSDGEGSIAWSGFDEAEVRVEMSGVSLAAEGRGDITRD
ncbi:MAG: MopE-related protein [Pseudomonadota bacterium]|nr:MopE-related protein [Pseudomonadota bacterium]